MKPHFRPEYDPAKGEPQLWFGTDESSTLIARFNSTKERDDALRKLNTFEVMVDLVSRLHNRWANTNEGSPHRIIDNDDAREIATVIGVI